MLARMFSSRAPDAPGASDDELRRMRAAFFAWVSLAEPAITMV